MGALGDIQTSWLKAPVFFTMTPAQNTHHCMHRANMQLSNICSGPIKMACHIVWRRYSLWNDTPSSPSPVSTLSSVHLVAEKGPHYHSEKGSPSNPPTPSCSFHQMRGSDRGGSIRVCVCVCVLACVNMCVDNERQEGVHDWGMCTCNFSHLTQLVFCRVSGTGRCLWELPSTPASPSPQKKSSSLGCSQF